MELEYEQRTINGIEDCDISGMYVNDQKIPEIRWDILRDLDPSKISK